MVEVQNDPSFPVDANEKSACKHEAAVNEAQDDPQPEEVGPDPKVEELAERIPVQHICDTFNADAVGFTTKKVSRTAATADDECQPDEVENQNDLTLAS